MKKKKKNSQQLEFQYWNSISTQPTGWISNYDIILRDIDTTNELEKSEANFKGLLK